MIKEAIVKIVNKEDLTYDEAYTVMNEIMSGQTSETQNAAFLAALSTKSARAETTDEIAGCAAAMRAHATRVETGMELFEIVGTGGDQAQSFNISTTAALVAAAAGMKVAKHGNRAASSQCGTADCLEAPALFLHYLYGFLLQENTVFPYVLSTPIQKFFRFRRRNPIK